jgi:hypothetical protein
VTVTPRREGRRAPSRAAWAAWLLSCGLAAVMASAQGIPAPKLELIRQATVAMKIDQRIHGLIRQRVDARVAALRIDNPGLSDSLAAAARVVVAAAYASRVEGRDGLMARVHAVLDRHLTEEDLKFAVNFKGSDQGKRYRELAPRVVAESVEAGRVWGESLEPEIRRRLEETFRGQNLKL